MYPARIKVDTIEDELLTKKGIQLKLLRLDLIHPEISGNKYFKLKYNLLRAKSQGKQRIITLGGAFSNHIAATAFACKEAGIDSIGIIRGDRSALSNATLSTAAKNGMKLHFVSREDYRNKAELERRFMDLYGESDALFVPEGGANLDGIKGCSEIPELFDTDYDVVCMACGTGTTFAGCISKLPPTKKALGFQVLKADNYLRNEVEHWLKKMDHRSGNWEITEMAHEGGYAKRTPELIRFVDDFFLNHGIALDYIYTGKMMKGIFQLAATDYFPPGTAVLALHTGGLQGNQGFIKNRD